jgi:hypothetical protein
MRANTTFNGRKIELEDNNSYGIDLILDKSLGGEMVKISTGKLEHSFMFWQHLKLVSQMAIDEINSLKTTKCECDEFVNDCICKK